MLLKLIGLIFPLALDTFAVSAALGMTPVPARRKLSISLFFTAFETGMPIVGLIAGEPLHNLMGQWADFLAYGLLIAFGLFTLLHNAKQEQDTARSILSSWGLPAILLGITISIDEIAIGLTLGLLGFAVVPVLVVIAVQAFIFSQAGFWLGSKISEKNRERTEKLAGWALIGIGAGLLITHLLR